MMRIMQILPRMNVGGVERGVLDLVRYFKDSEIKNIVVSAGGRLVEALKYEGATHYRLAVHKKSLFSTFLIPKVRKIIEKEKINIVHARSRVPGWISFFASRATGTPFVTTAHGVYKSKFWSEVMGWGKFVICPSKYVARHMRVQFGVPQEKIVVINRWVDLNKFQFVPYHERKSSNVIVSIGRISPTKGYEYLIEGFKKAVRANPYLHLKIVGSPDKSKLDYFNHLKNLVVRYSLNYNVTFEGYRQDVENVLKEARLLVAPSIIDESFGRVVVEAFACGVPVIATKVGGFNEIIEDGKDAILVDRKDSMAIANNILRIFQDYALANKLVETGREKVTALYTMRKSMEQTREVYANALSSTRILVIKISSLGDLILAIPSLKALKERFPQGKITLLTLKKYATFICDCPYVDEIIRLEHDYKKWKNILEVSKTLRRKSFDYIIDLQNNRASHFISFLTFARASFGYSLRAGFLLSKKIKINRKDSPLVSQERILEFLGIKLKEKKLIFWEKKPTPKIQLPAANLIGINISASPKWKSKNWPDHHIVRLIELIQRNLPSFKVVLLGDETAQEKAKIIKDKVHPGPINFCGKTTLTQLPWAIKKLNAFITPDTATMHLGCALDIPTIALFGPTDPSRHVVPDKNIHVLYQKEPCSFCYSARCRQKTENQCMEKISPQEVFNKIKEII
ncbi:MAG: glycosyltransferase [Candidatus Omnitrophota bacterium]|nr:MAG: glycosyltransferase [Candidatus Omnitrophota bacterium]